MFGAKIVMISGDSVVNARRPIADYADFSFRLIAARAPHKNDGVMKDAVASLTLLFTTLFVPFWEVFLLG